MKKNYEGNECIYFLILKIHFNCGMSSTGIVESNIPNYRKKTKNFPEEGQLFPNETSDIFVIFFFLATIKGGVRV